MTDFAVTNFRVGWRMPAVGSTVLCHAPDGCREFAMRERRRVLASLVIISVLLAGLVALLSHPFDPDAISGDHLFYRSMSYNLFAVTRPDLNVSAPSSGGQMWKDGLNRQPPYVYRVVTPLLARGIAYATGINTAYYLISFWALVGAAVFIGLAIYEMTGSQVPSVAGAILFLSNWWTARFNLADYMLTDPIAFFLNAIAVWALVRRKRTLFFVVCAVGLLNKETMLPMLVAYPMSELLVDHRVPRSSIAFLIGIPVAMSAFRHAIPVPDGGYSLLGSFSGGMTSAKWVLLEGLTVFGAVGPSPSTWCMSSPLHP
jgi:hypothetical protein